MIRKPFALVSLMLASTNVFAAELPSAEALFKRHVEASYGEHGLSKHLSMTLHTQIFIEQFNATIPQIIKQKAPHFRYAEGNFMGTEVSSGCAGETCWEVGMQGEEVISGDELTRWLEQADYYRWNNIGAYAKHMETTGLIERDGQQVYRVKLVDNFSQENFYFFDTTTGLMVGCELMVADQGGFEPRTESYSKFKTFGAFTLPTKARTVQPSITRVTTVSNVSFEELPDSVFALPQFAKNAQAQPSSN